MPRELFASVRVAKISDLPELARMQSHGMRLDPSARDRVRADRTPVNRAASPYSPDDPLNLIAAFHVAREQRGAVSYGNAAIGLHLILIVSPALIEEHGDPHDPNNPLNCCLSTEGVAWAEGVFGAGSVFAWRHDMDEVGS